MQKLLAEIELPNAVAITVVGNRDGRRWLAVAYIDQDKTITFDLTARQAAQLSAALGADALETKLAAWLRASGMAKNDMAAKVGLNASGLSRVISGKADAPLKAAMEIEKLTGGKVKIADLCYDDNPENTDENSAGKHVEGGDIEDRRGDGAGQDMAGRE